MTNENINTHKRKPIKKKKEFINNSGKGKDYPVPAVISKKFNWGAFFFVWIWGIFNKTYITFLYFVLCWIPIVNIAALIWFGIKGNEWAWQNKRWPGIRAFHDHQKKWAAVGALFFVFSLVLFVMGIFFLSAMASATLLNTMNNI